MRAHGDDAKAQAVTASPVAQRVLVGVLVVLLAAIGAVLLTGASVRHEVTTAGSSPFDGPTFPAGVRAAGFSLVDQDGRRVSLSRYRGRIVVLTFVHSQCQDACPLMVEDIKGALNLLPGGASSVAAIGITADPAQDTRASRRAFLAAHEMTGRMHYLNGSSAALRRVWSAYHVAPVLPGQPDHSTFVILIDKRGVERVGIPVDQLTPEGLAHDIGVLARERA